MFSKSAIQYGGTGFKSIIKQARQSNSENGGAKLFSI